MAKIKHGDCGTRLYNIWKDMKRRCNPKFKEKYKYHAAKGITVCKEWEDYLIFKEWSLTHGYSDNLSIDRKDNSKGYEPNNCRWVDDYVQASNSSQNVYVEYENEDITLAELSRKVGICEGTIRWRYKEGLRGEELIKPLQVTMKGKHHSEETKKRISEASKNKPHKRDERGRFCDN